MPSGFFYLYSFNWSIFTIGDIWLVLLLQCFREIPVLNANSVVPDQTPRSAASDLGLHCLPMSLFITKTCLYNMDTAIIYLLYTLYIFE